jgi:hypothetical protein
MTSFCFVFIDVIVLLCKERECQSCGSVEDCELSEDAGVNGSVRSCTGFVVGVVSVGDVGWTERDGG